jgi:4-alpha-glucanotransferase
MNLTFRLRFATKPGQSLWLAGQAPLPAQLPMHFLDQEYWQATVPLAANQAHTPLNYSYILRNDDGSKATDWGRDRVLVPADFKSEDLLVIDSWNAAGYVDNAFYTEPFKRVLFADKSVDLTIPAPASPTHTFRVKAPLLKKGQTLCLLGDGPVIGNWQTQTPQLLSRLPGEDYFSVELDLRGQPFPLAYKYGIFDLAQNSFTAFETGDNRVLRERLDPKWRTFINDGFARVPATSWRGAGVAVPVFSLRTDNGFGTGEFLDLKALADWGQKTGLKLIQLLPVNDTSATHTWKDSYPYAAISAFALHPLYLNLAAVANAKNQRLLKDLEGERLRLNALPEMDYEAVMRAKLDFLRQIFPSQKASTFRSKDYKSFYNENQHWLVPYAAFCCLRDLFGTPDCQQWPEHKTYDEKKISELAPTNEEMAFHFFVQFHLHKQLSEAAAYVHAAGLVVKGDIAIGVYRYGADTWQSPELFHMDGQAGAPPDPFAAKGQNWGFPTYNWLRMAADGFAWWKQRFTQMGNYFDAFRIDHILGFFRIWTIPTDAVEGILGHFVPAIPLSPDEFSKLGIAYDRKRFTQPFITDAVLEEVFGSEASHVRQNFLTAQSHGHYALKTPFTTQQQVEKHFAAMPADERHARLKIGLFDLISNVILLEGEGKLHFRFTVEQTSSYKHLPPETRKALSDLYVDYFFRRQDEFWKKEAWQKLPALKRVTNMLICGEDLGLVPACVPDVMRDLGFLSLEIQRMPKMFGTDFSRPADAPYLSVVTPSTHDMSTIRGWWTEDRALTQTFYHRELGLHGEAPAEAAPEIVARVLQQHLASPAMWSIFQLQDLLGMDGQLRHADVAAERINIPANPNHYWRYRLHLKLEDLLAADEFNGKLRKMLQGSGR